MKIRTSRWPQAYVTAGPANAGATCA